MTETSNKLPTSFRKLAWSNLFAQFSEQLALAAAPIVAVLYLKTSAVGTGLLQTAQTLPFLLLSLPAGFLADRYAHRKLMLRAEVARTLALVFIMFLLVSSSLTLLQLALLGFVGVTGTVCYSVAVPALVPTLVNRNNLHAANRWLELARSIAYAGGPAIGGAIVGWAGAPLTYTMATTCSLLAIILLSRAGNAPVRSLRNERKGLKETVVFCFSQIYLRPMIFTGMLFSISWFILQAVFVSWAISHLGIQPQVLGLVMGAYGVGMVTGATISTFLGRHLTLGWQISLGPLTAFVGSIIMLTTLLYHSPLLPGAAFFLFGAGPVIWSITTTSLRQSVTPNGIMGGVSGIVLVATSGCRPIGALIGTVTASLFNVQTCLALSTFGFLAQLLVIRLSPVASLRSLPRNEET